MFIDINDINASVKLTQALVKEKSVTPEPKECFNIIETILIEHGFKVTRKIFSQTGTYDVENLYASFGNGNQNIMLAGHIDVVPAGNIDDWEFDPFSGEIKDGYLLGRGAQDMKSGVASGVISAIRLSKNPKFHGKISLLITADEEQISINGTGKMLQYMHDNGEAWDCALMLEPTNVGSMSDQIKVGRRGTLTAELVIYGKQGHVGYPSRVVNAIHLLCKALSTLSELKLDNGTDFFEPSSLQVVDIKGGTGATNIAPGIASSIINIRFNNNQNHEKLMQIIQNTIDNLGFKYKLTLENTSECFFTDPKNVPLCDELASAVADITGIKPEFSTVGGTSDSRFVTKFCPVVDYGVSGETIHQVNEKVKVSEIIELDKIILQFLNKKFNSL